MNTVQYSNDKGRGKLFLDRVFGKKKNNVLNQRRSG